MERRHVADLDKHAAAIVHHLVESGPTGDHARLLRYLVRAGRWAIEAAAFEDAVAHLERARTLPDPAPAADWAAFLDDLARA